jgi:hypothetical protein
MGETFHPKHVELFAGNKILYNKKSVILLELRKKPSETCAQNFIHWKMLDLKKNTRKPIRQSSELPCYQQHKALLTG